jgi:Leucine-rich repeat (LRR) protein
LAFAGTLLSQLEQLSLAGNDITTIPEQVGKLKNLRKVRRHLFRRYSRTLFD